MKPRNIRIESIRRLYTRDRCARALLNHSARPNSTFGGRESTVEHLQNVLTAENLLRINRRELIRTLRHFERIGCGRFVAGRRSRSSRILWSEDPRELGLKIIDPVAAGLVPAATIAASSPAASRERAPAGILEESGQCVHPFRLRRDLTLFLRLPADLTRGEAARLAAFMHSLPLEETSEPANQPG